MIARIKNTSTPFGIDFGVGDVIVPKQEKRKIPTQLADFDPPTVNTYSLETTVAEKTDDYNTVLRTIKEFLAEPFAMTFEDEAFHLKWFVGKQSWE